jgi:hypothetical protein
MHWRTPVNAYEKSDRRSGWALLLGTILCCVLFLLALAAGGCATDPAKREAQIKFVEDAGKFAAAAVPVAAGTGNGPVAAVLGLSAAVIGLGVKVARDRNLRRTLAGTAQVLEQVVLSVDAAYPEKTEEQKAKLNEFQDETTREIVSRIKGE